jgi:hypothetical protein
MVADLPQPPVVAVVLRQGRADAEVSFRRGAGTIVRFRLTVPHGARVRAAGRLVAGPSWARGRRRAVAGATIATGSNCRASGAVDVCSQPMEACPLPSGVWRFRVRKLSGQAGAVRIELNIA